MTIKVFQWLSISFLCSGLAGTQTTWTADLRLQTASQQDTLIMGGHPLGTEHFDVGLDSLAPPPPISSYYTFFQINDVLFNSLGKDIRRWQVAYDTTIDWMLQVSNANGVETTLSWNSADLADNGFFTLIDTVSVNMRIDSVFQFKGSRTLTIRYCLQLTDTQVVSTPGIYCFNPISEGGDGHDVNINFIQLTGSGVISVAQTNEPPQNPIHEHFLPYSWSIVKDTGIGYINATVVFKYKDVDITELNENRLKVYHWNGSDWNYEGGIVDSDDNTVTVQLGHFSEFGIFESPDFVNVKIKSYLEGPYQSGGNMTTNLKTAGSIPTTSSYIDTRTVISIPEGVTDWVSVELRNLAIGPAVTQRSFFIKSDGSIVDQDGTTTDLEIPDITAGSYYVVIRNRNHLAVMSASAQSLSNAPALLFDFSTSIDQYYGTEANRAKQVETGVYGMVAGDTNGTGTVDANDRSSAWNNRNKTGYESADCNLSGTVDANDRSITWNNRNKTTSVP